MDIKTRILTARLAIKIEKIKRCPKRWGLSIVPDSQRKRVRKMLTAIFIIAALLIGFKLIGFAFRATWRVGAVILFIALIPVIALVLFFGLIWIALPILLVIGLIVLIVKAITCAISANRFLRQFTLPLHFTEGRFVLTSIYYFVRYSIFS